VARNIDALPVAKKAFPLKPTADAVGYLLDAAAAAKNIDALPVAKTFPSI